MRGKLFIEVKVDRGASEALSDLVMNLQSLKEDLPWRDEIDAAMDAVVIIANNMVVLDRDRVIGRITATREI